MAIDQTKSKYYDDAAIRQLRVQRAGQTTKLSFPEATNEAYEGRIRFTTYKAEPLDVNFGSFFNLPIFDNVLGRSTASTTNTYDDAALRQLRAQRADAFSSEVGEKRKQIEDAKKESSDASAALIKGASYALDRNSPVIDLYIPISIVIADAVQYDNTNLGFLGGAALAGMQQGGSIMNSMYEGLSSGLSNIFGFIMGAEMTSEAARLGAVRAANRLPQGVQSAVSIGIQRTINPNTRALFRGVTIREFSFTFKMIASSAKEAQTVEKIIKHFRKEMYPEVYDPTSGGLPLAYKFPNAFGIEFLYKGQEAKISKIDKCFLRTASTTYNPQSSSFHTDGQPVEIDLTLNFTEMRTLSKQDIEKGF